LETALASRDKGCSLFSIKESPALGGYECAELRSLEAHRMPISHVELELAREPAHPFGDREHAYDLYLPLLDDGRIDAARARCCDGHCRFRCRRPGQCEVRGAIRLEAADKLALDSVEAGSGEVHLPSVGGPFRPGELLPIADASGGTHLFQILSIRQEW
jgi:hypothetical protein